MADERDEVVARVSALLDELMGLIKPRECNDPTCHADHEDNIPEGPWMVSGWVLSVDVTAEGATDVETWTTCWASKGLPRTQALGMAMTLVNWKGG